MDFLIDDDACAIAAGMTRYVGQMQLQARNDSSIDSKKVSRPASKYSQRLSKQLRLKTKTKTLTNIKA